MAETNIPQLDTIRAAVAGEKWAVEKVLDCYSDEIDKLATVEEKQPDGSVTKEIDKDMRQALVLKLIEAIPHFPIDEVESEGEQ